MNNASHLWTFYQVAQAESVSAGAKRLFVTQSAVSQSLKNLEIHYGVVLAERSRRGFKLTEAGLKLFRYCDEMFSRLETVREELASMNSEPEGIVTLGCDITMAMTFFIRQVPLIQKRFPKLKILLRTTPTTFILRELLDRGDIDIAAINESFIEGIQSWDVMRLPFSVFVYLYGSPKYLKKFELKKPEDVLKMTFIEVDENTRAGNWFIQNTIGRADKFASYHYLSADFIEAVKSGLGVTISPESYVSKSLKEGSIVKVFPKILKLPRQDCLCVMKSRVQLPKIAALMGYFRMGSFRN